MAQSYDAIMKWGSRTLPIVLLLGSALLIIIKIKYHLSWGIFVPLLGLLQGLLALAIKWYRHEQARKNVTFIPTSHACDVSTHELDTVKSHVLPEEIDQKSLSVLHNVHIDADSIVQTEMNAAISAVSAQLNRMTNRPRYPSISNRTTISTTLGVYGEIEPPLPVIRPLRDSFLHSQKQNLRVRSGEIVTSLVPAPSHCRDTKSYCPLYSSPCASARTSYIIEMYADFAQPSRASIEHSEDRDQDRIQTGTPL